MKIKIMTPIEHKVAELEKKVAQLEKLHGSQNAPVQKEPETFEDCILVHKEAFDAIDPEISIAKVHYQGDLRSGRAVPSTKRAKQLIAIAKMMTVADALNGNSTNNDYWLCLDKHGCVMVATTNILSTRIGFKHLAAAEKAIKVLGEETIKTAFGL
jgi:hypothetical protein